MCEVIWIAGLGQPSTSNEITNWARKISPAKYLGTFLSVFINNYLLERAAFIRKSIVRRLLFDGFAIATLNGSAITTLPSLAIRNCRSSIDIPLFTMVRRIAFKSDILLAFSKLELPTVRTFPRLRRTTSFEPCANLSKTRAGLPSTTTLLAPTTGSPNSFSRFSRASSSAKMDASFPGFKKPIAWSGPYANTSLFPP